MQICQSAITWSKLTTETLEQGWGKGGQIG